VNGERVLEFVHTSAGLSFSPEALNERTKMAKLPTPDGVNDPRWVQKFGVRWMEKFYLYYPPSKAFNINPGKYDIDFASVQGINESFIISRYGYAINTAMFYDLKDKGFSQWKLGDGVYYPIGGDGKVSIYNMRDDRYKKNVVVKYDYKWLCDKYLKSTRAMLIDTLPNSKFW